MIEVKVEQEQWDDVGQIRQSVQNIETGIKESKVKLEEKKEENRLITDLINENVISVSSLDKKILDKRFITVLCYQIGFKYEISPKLKKLMQTKEVEIKRKYNKIFDEVGFIKLAYTYPFYIIPEDNLFPKSLNNLNKLADYLMKKAKIILAEEWDELRSLHQKHDPNHYQKIKNKANPLNFNILIMKVNRRDMRHKYFIKNDFNKAFISELSTLVKLEKMNILEPEKVQIKELILGSSLKILILSLSESDKKKILELESEFTKPEAEGGLGIKHFYDYYQKDISKLKSILSKKFKTEKVNEMKIDLIMKNSKDYETDLRKLNINF